MNAILWWALASSSNLTAAVDDCRPCHAGIVEAFRKTGMGRSLSERPIVLNASFYHRISNRYYTFADGKLKRHQLDAAGREINVVEKSIDYAIGSGNHAITYAARGSGGRLIELPVSWYAREKAWFMSPGYDAPDHPDMRREVVDACLFCHSDTREPASITCRRCHGDASTHLRAPGRANIYNPKQSIEVCLQCHLETVSQGITDSIRRPGRDAFSYKPGEVLASYKLYFDRADAPINRFEVNHAGYRLMQSACFLKSRGKLTCVTCHDPHTARARENACASCHDSQHVTEKKSGCAGCHMPLRPAQDAIHVSMTDHWIQRRPSFTNPDREHHTPYEGKVVSFYTRSDALSLGVANIRTPGPETADLLERYLRRAPADVATLVALGKTLVQLEQFDKAAKHLRRAVELDPTHSGARVALGVALARLGSLDAALAELQAAVKVNPDDSFAWLNFAVTLREQKRYDEAAAAFREAIRLQPDLSAARTGLASLPVRP